MNRKITIYGLFDPNSLECFYIGQSGNTLETRKRHKRRFKGILTFIWLPIEALDCPQAATDREAYWIKKLWDLGEAKHNKNLPRKAYRREPR